MLGAAFIGKSDKEMLGSTAFDIDLGVVHPKEIDIDSVTERERGQVSCAEEIDFLCFVITC